MATFVPIPRVAGGSLIFLINLKGGDCSWAILHPGLLVMSAPRVASLSFPCVAFNGFFSFSDLRASTRFAECESNKLLASENIFRKFIYGRRARRNGAHCVPKTQRYV